METYDERIAAPARRSHFLTTFFFRAKPSPRLRTRLASTASARAAAPLRTARWVNANRTTDVVVIAACLVQVGCGGSSAAPTGEDQNVRGAMLVLGREYGAYTTQHNGVPPKDEAALRGYLQSWLEDLSICNVKSPDDLLGKGRDGHPLQVVYGAKMPALERLEYIWAAYEQTGVDGKRLASDSRGGVYELDVAEFSNNSRKLDRPTSNPFSRRGDPNKSAAESQLIIFPSRRSYHDPSLPIDSE
jgi:hypothetical protein